MTNFIKIAVLYGLFALVATFANILTQAFVIYIYTASFHILISIIMGTGVGLIIKYILDKKFIFKYKVKNTKHESKVFTLYLIMGILTTLIFWGFELAFHLIYQSDSMRYIGGIIGLMIGYICKYFLDKRFVFQTV